MTRPLPVVLAVAALAAAAAPLVGQVPVRVRGGGFYESYSFDPGLPFRSVSEVALPLAVDVGLGRYATLTLSSGFVSINLESADTAAADQTLSGALDTELRLGVNVIPGRLILLASGALPTGIKSVEEQELTILAALTSDIVGFSVPSVGSGGTLGGGVVGAIPVGRFALGLGATFTHSLAYQPVVGQTDEIKPAAEIRGRAGIEGPLGRTTYLRVATVVARRGKDEFAGAAQNGVGMRFIGYGEVAQGLGNMQLTLYGYDVYRGSPQLEATAIGQAILPKGNLIVGGLRFSLPVTRTTTILPRAEFRYSSQAQGGFDSTDAFVQGPMEKAGTSWRFGVDLRQHLAGPFAMVASGGVLTGNIVQAGTDIGLSGYRFGLLLEVTR
jgi:hypothetical protein